MLDRDSEDEFWSRFVFELLIWTQPSGPLCLWQCFVDSFVIFPLYLFETVLLLRDLSLSVGTFYCWEIWEALLRDLKLIWGEQTIRITSHTQGWFGVGFPRTRMVLSPLTWISWWLMYVVARWRLIGSFPVCSNTSPCVCDPGLPAPSATQGLLGLNRENTELERISTPLKSSTVVKDFNETQTTSKVNPTSTWSF